MTMQLVYHLGLHCTDDDNLRRSISRNEEVLRERGVLVPPPGVYRKAIRETVNELRGEAPSPETSAWLMDQITSGRDSERVILSNENFICLIPAILAHGVWYGLAAPRVHAFDSLIPEAETEFFLAIRNPATMIPALDARATELDYDALTYGNDVRALRWSEMIARIRAAVPHARIVVWCNEDTPLIWSRLMHALTGTDPDLPLEGTETLLESILTEEGLFRMRRWIADHAPRSEAQRQAIIAAFLERFAPEEKLEQEVDLPGWTDDFVDGLTATYDEDVALIAAMDGVEFIAPE